MKAYVGETKTQDKRKRQKKKEEITFLRRSQEKNKKNHLAALLSRAREVSLNSFLFSNLPSLTLHMVSVLVVAVTLPSARSKAGVESPG